MFNTNYPAWLVGRLPENVPGVPTTSKIILRSGNRSAKRKQEKNDERKRIMRKFIAQLDFCLAKRAAELKALDDANPFSEILIKAIVEFFAEVIANNDATTKHKASTPPRTLENAAKLLGPLKEFKQSIDSCTKTTPIEPTVCAVLDELIGDVEHFIRSIQITHAIVKIDGGKPRMRNRPRKTDAMAAYYKIVLDLQSRQGQDNFPKPREIHKQMLALGHDIPERTMRDWKRQMKEGTFGHHVQNRKRQ